MLAFVFLNNGAEAFKILDLMCLLVQKVDVFLFLALLPHSVNRYLSWYFQKTTFKAHNLDRLMNTILSYMKNVQAQATFFREFVWNLFYFVKFKMLQWLNMPHFGWKFIVFVF